MEEFVLRQHSGIDFWQSRMLSATGIAHGFLGAQVDSKAPGATAVLRDFLPHGSELLLLRQVHGVELYRASESLPSSPPEADGSFYWSVQAEPGPVLGILTADCAPVLLVSHCLRFYAALHCGWRGTQAGLLAVAVASAQRHGIAAEDLRCLIGPSAGPCCYEVGPEFVEEFRRTTKNFDYFRSCFATRAGRQYFDNSGFLLLQAKSLGISPAQCRRFPSCTICDERFFSYRRQKADAGRQLSFIGGSAPHSFL